MKTYFLKFTDESEAKAALSNYLSEDGWILASHDHALDVVGTIYKPTGEVVDETPVMAPLDGFHVNLAIDVIPIELDQYVIHPNSPSRVFA